MNGSADRKSSPSRSAARSTFSMMTASESPSSIRNARRRRLMRGWKGIVAREGQGLALEPRRSLADLTPELPEKAGLADPGLPHDGHDLPAPRLRLVEALAQEPELGLTADEAGEPLLDVPSGHEPVRAGGRSGHGAGRGQLEAPGQEGAPPEHWPSRCPPRPSHPKLPGRPRRDASRPHRAATPSRCRPTFTSSV